MKILKHGGYSCSPCTRAYTHIFSCLTFSHNFQDSTYTSPSFKANWSPGELHTLKGAKKMQVVLQDWGFRAISFWGTCSAQQLATS